ncbi:hypothetical protein BDV26DRAFT_245893 [Aspergillus bertholletiae]|uniref:Uncharacterized protein n=1 Tax=Aspergillus bertholletiae TaxID=1226010 RepID=A0A5N7B1Y5_9EURO|nr:hypothetical protein BDV26DRAFT_245893 [Aspergillus bertholletiae]
MSRKFGSASTALWSSQGASGYILFRKTMFVLVCSLSWPIAFGWDVRGGRMAFLIHPRCFCRSSEIKLKRNTLGKTCP